MATEEVGVKLTAEGADGFVSDMKRAEKANAGFVDSIEKGSQQTSGASQVMIGALRQVGAVAVEALGAAVKAVGDFVTDSIKVAGDFEAGMNRFSVAAGDALTEAGLKTKDFRDLFIDLGKRLPVSTQEVQDAAIELVKGGIDPLILKAGGLESSLQFAAAGELDLVKASEISVKTLATFTDSSQTAAEKTAFLAKAQDLMVQAAGSSSLSVETLNDAMLGAAGQARATGVDYKDFVTTMGAIAPSFGSAQEAGTSYKNFLVRLQPTTKKQKELMLQLGITTEEGGNKFFDATGKFVGNRKAAEILHTTLSGLTDQERVFALQTLFGNDAMGAANKLAELGANGYDNYAKELDKASTVSEAAAGKQKGFNVAMDNFNGSIEALKITIGSALLPVLTELFNTVLAPAINTVTTLAETFFNATDKAEFFRDNLNQLIPGLGGIVDVVSVVVTFVGNLIASFQQAGTTVNSVGTLFTEFFGTVQTVVGLISSIIADLARIIGQWVNENRDELESTFGEAWQTVQSIFETAFKIIVTILANISTFINNHSTEIKTVLTLAWTVIKTIIKTTLDTIRGVVQLVLALIQGDWQGALDTLNETVERILNDIAGLFGTTMEDIRTTVSDAIAGVGTAISAGLNDAYQSALTFVTKFGQFGIDLVQAIINGINSIANNIYNAIIAPINQALQAGFQGIIDFINGIIAIFGGTPIGGGSGSKTASSLGGAKTVSHVSASGSSGTNNYTTSSARNYNLTVNSSQSAASLSSQFAIMEALAG